MSLTRTEQTIIVWQTLDVQLRRKIGVQILDAEQLKEISAVVVDILNSPHTLSEVQRIRRETGVDHGSSNH
jgi:hypothetical protein